MVLYFTVTAVLYFYSYGVLCKVYPDEAEDVALIDTFWYLSKSKSSYLGWLILGYYVPLFKGSYYRWLFELSRVTVVVAFFLFIYSLLSMLSPAPY